ncbi:MAG: outer membrane beta-barrel protein, partial [Acidobacteriaceae bacterium]
TTALGNMGQNVYSGPALVTFDASLQRTFDIHGDINLNFRVQAFNALNHPVFANPTTSLTSASFGQVTSTLGGADSSAGSRALQIAATLHF